MNSLFSFFQSNSWVQDEYNSPNGYDIVEALHQLYNFKSSLEEAVKFVEHHSRVQAACYEEFSMYDITRVNDKKLKDKDHLLQFLEKYNL